MILNYGLPLSAYLRRSFPLIKPLGRLGGRTCMAEYSQRPEVLERARCLTKRFLRLEEGRLGFKDTLRSICVGTVHL